MKKIIAVIMALSIAFTLGIPAFAAEEPENNSENVLDIVETEEFKEMLAEDGVDVEEFEEKIENGDFVIVEDEEDLKEVLTDEEIEEIRRQEALSVFAVVGENATTALIGLVMLPFIPVMLIIPVFGWVTSFAAIQSPFLLISLPFQFLGACVEAIVTYVNFDDSIYRTEVANFFVK